MLYTPSINPHWQPVTPVGVPQLNIADWLREYHTLVGRSKSDKSHRTEISCRQRNDLSTTAIILVILVEYTATWVLLVDESSTGEWRVTGKMVLPVTETIANY